jgi:sugar/nucleoside kinase (ribokinase family)
MKIAQNSDKLPAVLGIGNALVDVLIQVEDDCIIKQFGLPKGSMTLVNAELSARIYQATASFKKDVATGGSAANTIYALAHLGGKCGYLGKIKDDELGKAFKREFDTLSVMTHLYYSQIETGRVMALVTPDSERTMATYLGAAADLKPTDIHAGDFEGYSVLYIEGYLVQDHLLIETAIKTAKSMGMKIAIDLSSFNVVEQNLDFLKRIISKYVDIVFANEDEALAYTGKVPIEALEEIALQCEIAIVKIGKEGSLIKRGEEVVKVGIIKARAVDTTGAGDNYAAGFLNGYTQGLTLESCGKIAALVSGKVVEVVGARIPHKDWDEINRTIHQMINKSD